MNIAAQIAAKVRSQSPVIGVVLLMEIGLIVVLQVAPKPKPELYANILGGIFAFLPLIFTYLRIPMYPAAWNLSWRRTGIALALLGILPPTVGLVEASLSGDPQNF